MIGHGFSCMAERGSSYSKPCSSFNGTAHFSKINQHKRSFYFQVSDHSLHLNIINLNKKTIDSNSIEENRSYLMTVEDSIRWQFVDG